MSGNKLAALTLGELIKRVPRNQMEQFKAFRDKTFEYQRRANRYPDKLPSIDWEYYRQNVRNDYVNMVKEFQVKYRQLDQKFAKRHDVLDHSKYYKELESLKSKAQDEVQTFIDDSKERIKIYEEELTRIKNLNYENMTIEEFVETREDIATYIPGQGKPLFWPHTPEEQHDYVPETEVTETDDGDEEVRQDKPRT